MELGVPLLAHQRMKYVYFNGGAYEKTVGMQNLITATLKGRKKITVVKLAVAIPYQYKVEGSDMNLGLLVLCDGICTPFSVGDGTPKLLNEISLNAEEQTDIPYVNLWCHSKEH